MKTLWKVVKIFFGSIGALILLAAVSVFIYHHYQLNKEAALLKEKGTLVDVDGKKMNVYQEGSGKDTFVFMSGSGIAAPAYEMKGLYSKFSKENKIAVVDRAGYGYSDVYDDDRDIDTILEQTRKALLQSGNKPPYILMPHSISGIEAIYWAQKYPEEIKAIIAMDIGLPQQYVTYKLSEIDRLKMRGFHLLTSIGFHRFMPSAVYNPEVIRQSFLTDEEKEIYKAIHFKQFFNADMEHELLQSYQNGSKSMNLPAPKETPVLILDAVSDQNRNSKYAIQNRKDYEAFAAQFNTADIKELRGTHSIYLYQPDQIYKLSMEFIRKVR
ncbi:alpha/beta hydrolase [Bacillus halotolerans]|uniref:Alpha/beta hydrolase n=1 Tax=Bacillus halotolerans TaxID=260554 RepID=A0ABY7I2B1_9BACI|nr:alpha/beta hydrolase [Bacillus halotolerans]MBV5124058.1 alpha/beta hydrolase [Bacillus halotolerans]MDG0767390.1 alpha/beta hydrolase [Bacillus halotolerans]WAT21651.1 alpha/beta hydrolase [Bacillus halotolerans]